MEAVKKRWPSMLVQFEDFNTELAFDLLDTWRDRHTCFNDDVSPFLSVKKISADKRRSKELHLSFSVALSMPSVDQDLNPMNTVSCSSELEVLVSASQPC